MRHGSLLGACVMANLQGLNGRTLQGFFRTLQGFSGGNSDIFFSYQDGGSVKVFSRAGVLSITIGSFGTGDGEFSAPQGMFIHNNLLYVVDSNYSSVDSRAQVFDLSGAFISEFSVSSSISSGIFIYEEEIYIVDTGSVRVFDLIGTPARSWSVGSVSLDVCVFGNEVYVLNYTDKSVEVYSTSGTYLRTFGNTGSGDELLVLPYSLDIHNGKVYCRELDTIRVYLTSGAYVTKWNAIAGGVIIPGISYSNGELFTFGEVSDNIVIQGFDLSGNELVNFNTGITLIGGTGNLSGIRVI